MSDDVLMQRLRLRAEQVQGALVREDIEAGIREIASLRAEAGRLNQIVMAVETKYPGEKRWETALRYVREMESFCTTAQGQANRPRLVEHGDE
jgi:hypothetical protein